MEDINLKKLNRSIKIYPLFYGLSADLMFWIAINTLFLTTVKNLTPVEINSMIFIGTIIAFIIQLFSVRIIRRIGNINSIKVGTIMLFIAAVLFTLGNSYYLLLIAQILYLSGFIFKQMDSVVLIKNLKCLDRFGDYIRYQSKGSTLYSLFTCIIAVFSGLLFNINNYLPMIICISVCLIDIVIAFLMYEIEESGEKIDKKKNSKIFFNKKLILIIILFGLFYGIVSVGQDNSKLFMQYNMEEFLKIDVIAIYLSIFVTISRIIRLLFNILFLKIYNKLKNNILYLLEIFLLMSFVFLIIGDYIGNGMTGIIVMSLGFFLFLIVRDPFDNSMKKLLFENCNSNDHDKAIVYLSLSGQMGQVLFSGLVLIILLKHDYVIVSYIFIIIILCFIFLINKILKNNRV